MASGGKSSSNAKRNESVSSQLGLMCDHADLNVVRAGQTRKGLAHQALPRLQQSGWPDALRPSGSASRSFPNGPSIHSLSVRCNQPFDPQRILAALPRLPACP